MPASDIYAQCAQAIARFYSGLDQQDDESLLSCVVSDTVWFRQGQKLTGPDEIQAALSQRSPERITSHQCSNLQVVPADDGMTATATYYLTVYDNQHPTAGLQLKTILRSKDVFRLQDGKWVLASKLSTKHL